MVKFICALIFAVCAAGIPFFVGGNRASIGSCSVEQRDEELENYIEGVVAGEMPADFPIEALKAQAVAARTYAYRAKIKDEGLDYKSLYQSYLDESEMRKRWGEQYEQKRQIISSAVNQTAGEILTYNDEPVLAVFCSSVAGSTRDSAEVWTQSLPYLKQIKSEGDEAAPNYISAKILKKSEVKEILGSDRLKIKNNLSSDYVDKVQVGDDILSGDEVREKLGLRSSAFKIEDDGDKLIFITTGYGHGVGMSQYGAAEMAGKGKNYREILLHYYSGAKLEKIKN